MIVYVVRHGIAVELGEGGALSDADRMLSPTGVRRTRRAARGLARLGCRPERILSSPLTRAMQTAAIFAEALLPAEGAVEPCEAMSGSLDALGTIEWLSQQPDVETLLVGHMPHVVELVSALLCDVTHVLDITFKKAAVCRLSWDGRAIPGAARLDWLLQPGALRAIGGHVSVSTPIR